MRATYTAGDIEQIAYGIHDLHNLFKTWAHVGNGIESIRQGDCGEAMATMFSLAFDQAEKLSDHLTLLDMVAGMALAASAGESAAADQGEPGAWRSRLWSWGDTLDVSINWLVEISQTLTLVESRAGDDEHHGPVALAHDRLLEAIVDLRKLKEEISLFHAAEDAPVTDSEATEETAPRVVETLEEARALHFPRALKKYRSAAALVERLQDETEEWEAAYSYRAECYRIAMLTEAMTVADALEKLELFEDFRCDDGGSMDRDIEAEIIAAFADVRNLLAGASAAVSPEIAARVKAWRLLRDQYNACEATDDATIDPLHDAKQEAYNALLAEPVQTFGDVLAMAHTIKEEDNHGTPDACHYDVAFDALLAAVESLAAEAGR